MQQKAINACMKLRDMLIPVCPVITIKGKKRKILPVAFIHRNESGDLILKYSLPPKSGAVKIPKQINGFPIESHVWQGPAPKETQDLAIKLFGANP